MKTPDATPDANADRVKEILRGASRGPADPDVALSEVLSRIPDADSSFLGDVLEKLARDARSD